MNNITLTIELCAEDRGRIDSLILALKGLPVQSSAKVKAEAGAIEKAAEGMKAAAESAKQAAEATKSPEPEPVAPAPVEEPAPVEPEPAQPETVPQVTTAELQSKVVQLVNAGKKDAAKAIVMEYAQSVSQVPEDKRAEVLQKLNALEG